MLIDLRNQLPQPPKHKPRGTHLAEALTISQDVTHMIQPGAFWAAWIDNHPNNNKNTSDVVTVEEALESALEAQIQGIAQSADAPHPSLTDWFVTMQRVPRTGRIGIALLSLSYPARIWLTRPDDAPQDARWSTNALARRFDVLIV